MTYILHVYVDRNVLHSATYHLHNNLNVSCHKQKHTLTLERFDQCASITKPIFVCRLMDWNYLSKCAIRTHAHTMAIISLCEMACLWRTMNRRAQPFQTPFHVIILISFKQNPINFTVRLLCIMTSIKCCLVKSVLMAWCLCIDTSVMNCELLPFCACMCSIET